MHELADFLRHIKANPEDETSKLVFADWLDEHPSPVETLLDCPDCSYGILFGSREKCPNCKGTGDLPNTERAERAAFLRLGSKEREKQKFRFMTIARWRCPTCGSADDHYVKNQDPVWRDGDVHCNQCDCYVRMFDPG